MPGSATPPSLSSRAPLLRLIGPLIGPERLALLGEFLRFGVVGTIGFLVDSAVLLAGLGLGLGLYSGRIVSYIAAASTTWALNRAWTFRGHGGKAPAWRQWGLFLFVNLIGFACNYGTYAALVSLSPVVEQQPVIGVAAGAIAGLAGNFLLSRRFVFRREHPPQPDP